LLFVLCVEKLPASWEPMNEGDNLKVVPLDPNSQEFKDVEQNARLTSKATINQIIKISRIQNKLVYRQYVTRKEEMDKMNQGSVNPTERILWHGTDVSATNEINETGFNRSFNGKNATAYGDGVYFAINFDYSAGAIYAKPDPADNSKNVYQCKVLVGDFVRGTQGLIVPPQRPLPLTRKYDSVTDNPTAPNMFVIFYDTQAVPEYLIKFK